MVTLQTLRTLQAFYRKATETVLRGENKQFSIQTVGTQQQIKDIIFRVSPKLTPTVFQIQIQMFISTIKTEIQYNRVNTEQLRNWTGDRRESCSLYGLNLPGKQEIRTFKQKT